MLSCALVVTLAAAALSAPQSVGRKSTGEDGRGRVTVVGVTPRGDLLCEGWGAFVVPCGDGERFSAFARVDPALGVARIEGVPAGSWEVRFVHQHKRLRFRRRVELAEAGAALLRIVAHEVPPDERIDIACNGPIRADECRDLRLVAPDGSLAEALPSDWVRSFRAAPDVEYRAELLDPRFEPLTREGLRAGDSVKFDPVGSAALSIQLRPDRDGRAAGAQAVCIVRREDGQLAQARQQAQGAPVTDLLAAPFAALVPGVYDVHLVHGTGERAAPMSIQLGPGDKQRLEFPSLAGASVDLRVQDRAGAPLALGQYRVREIETLERIGTRAIPDYTAPLRRLDGQLDERGGLTAAGLAPGSYQVVVTPAGGTFLDRLDWTIELTDRRLHEIALRADEAGTVKR